MLKFYYAPLSPVARRVWLALLEKGIPFEPIVVNLDGEQFQPEYLAINPFHHVPAIVDDGFRVIESLAILDYLEIKYPTPSLLPKDPQTLAKMRMVEMVTANELLPQAIALIYESEDSPKLVQAKQQIDTVLQFYTEMLGDRLYFCGDELTLADIVAGAAVPLLSKLGVDLSNYTRVNDWLEAIAQRPAWQQTELSADKVEAFKRRVKALVRLRMSKMK